jgi:hypothetical protein
VTSIEEAIDIDAETKIILKTGYFLTTNFRKKHEYLIGTMVVTENDPDVIYYDSDTVISLKKRSKYLPKSKQLYIIENTLKTIINSKRVVYLDNTEQYSYKQYDNVEHLYGLASGWKTYRIARDIGLSNLKSITVYDFNETQLDYAKKLHSNSQLIDFVEHRNHASGQYNPPDDMKDFWPDWYDYPVKFEQIDLFDTPKFPAKSLVWISNVFKYEPTLFTYGWDECKNKRQLLINLNEDCTITEE